MTRLSRWWRGLLERWSSSFYEGPQPPDRLAEMVIAFAEMHPEATRRDWVAFASAHARECYRSGWTRGHEHVERDPDFFRDHAPDDVVHLEHREHEFAWSPNILLTRPDEAVPELKEPDASVLLRQLAEMRGKK